MLDTHCHLDSPAFDPDREEVLARARAAGVSELIVPAIGPDGWEPLLAWTSTHPGTHAALGIHPQLLPSLDPRDDDRHLARLDELLARGGAIGIGECGLDAATASVVPMERQLRIFEAHVALARKHHLPLLVHCLRAHDELMALFRRSPPPPTVLHSFSGSAEQARQYAAWETWFAFAGPITYEKARKPVAAARAIARGRLLVETDAPDQTPRPHRGRCEPAHIVETVAALGAALGITADEAGALTEANARALFKLGR
jgi:TatD DNase family protein